MVFPLFWVSTLKLVYCLFFVYFLFLHICISVFIVDFLRYSQHVWCALRCTCTHGWEEKFIACAPSLWYKRGTSGHKEGRFSFSILDLVESLSNALATLTLLISLVAKPTPLCEASTRSSKLVSSPTGGSPRIRCISSCRSSLILLWLTNPFSNKFKWRFESFSLVPSFLCSLLIFLPYYLTLFTYSHFLVTLLLLVGNLKVGSKPTKDKEKYTSVY